MKKATANLFLDTRKANGEGLFPIKLTIYYAKQKKRYGCNVHLSEQNWLKLNSKNLKDEKIRKIKISLNSILSKANEVIDSLKPFSFYFFEESFFGKRVEESNFTLVFHFSQYIKTLNDQNRIGTRISYQTTINSLENFKKNLKLQDITKEFLSQYEAFMITNGKSNSTIGIYLRNLRAIINLAIKSKLLQREDYPFSGYQIPSARNLKKALTDSELKMLLNYIPVTHAEKMAHDFWIFSYLCNGMNFTDILHLTPKNVEGNTLSFFRQKTQRTKKKDLRPIKVNLHIRALEIINTWRNKDSSSHFLFPFLEPGITAKTTKNRIQRFIKKVNAGMDIIRLKLKFPNKLGTYVARHSFSTRLMRKGAPTHFIKESLGHSSVATTESYLGDFSENIKKEYSDLLTNFE